MATIIHIFALSGIRQSEKGESPSTFLELGRYASNLERSPANSLHVRQVELPRLRVLVPGVTLEPTSLHAQLWSDGAGQGQLHLAYTIDDDAELAVDHLSVFCHRRHEISFAVGDRDSELEGVPALAAHVFDLTSTPDLQHDVLQFVAFDHLDDGLFEDDGLGREGLGIVYRRLDWALDDAGVGLPPQLNSRGVRGAAHGRGVVLLAGHEAATVNALRLTACELLLALGRARRMRRRLENALRRDLARQGDADRPGDLSTLTRLTTMLRRERMSLAMDVMAYADGLFSPELVLDNFRDSFATAIRFDDLVQSSTAMLGTLHEVVESYRLEAEVDARELQEATRQKWEVIVGVASGIAIPFALLLSYFGVSSQVIAPPTASIYSAHFILPWLVCALVALTITTLSLIRFRRQPRTRSGPVARTSHRTGAVTPPPATGVPARSTRADARRAPQAVGRG